MIFSIIFLLWVCVSFMSHGCKDVSPLDVKRKVAARREQLKRRVTR